jgi:hypothetical protein
MNLKTPLLNKAIFSCEIIVLYHKSIEFCITSYLIHALRIKAQIKPKISLIQKIKQ